jgi:hypothetical protein
MPKVMPEEEKTKKPAMISLDYREPFMDSA